MARQTLHRRSLTSSLLPRSTRFCFYPERFACSPRSVDCWIVAANWPAQDAPAGSATPGVIWVKADYEDQKQLAQILQGVHTVLSFIATQEDPASTVQKNLIDAAVQAGVKRFAPSEWSTWAVLISDAVPITDLLQIRPGAPQLVRVQGRNSPIPQRAE